MAIIIKHHSYSQYLLVHFNHMPQIFFTRHRSLQSSIEANLDRGQPVFFNDISLISNYWLTMTTPFKMTKLSMFILWFTFLIFSFTFWWNVFNSISGYWWNVKDQNTPEYRFLLNGDFFHSRSVSVLYTFLSMLTLL